MKLIKNLLLFILSLAVLGCSLSGTDSSGDGGITDPVVTEPVVETIKWEYQDSGYTKFSTNDIANLKKSFWVRTGSREENVLSSVEVEYIRESGADNYGSGVIFSAKDTSNFKVILIDGTGYFMVGEFVDKSFYKVVDWTVSSALNTGYVSNKIKITFDSTTDSYSVYFNNTYIGDTPLDYYTDQTSAGAPGFYVGVGDEESNNFPDTPSSHLFKYID